MGISLLYFQFENKKQWGILEGEKVHSIGEFQNFRELVSSYNQLKTLVKTTYSVDDVTILAPETNPTKVVCQGVNYADHRKEGGYDHEKPSYNMIFSKSLSSITGPFNDIIKPKHVKLLDYEIELALVIKQDIVGPVEVNEANLADYIAGIIIANDISARDIQIPQEQWEKGKSYRTFCPIGPVLYLIDESDIPLLHELELKLWVNGELRQQNSTKNLLFKPKETLTELSGVMDFTCGDLLLTGTPSGVAIKSPPPLIQNLLSLLVKKEKKMQLFVKGQTKNAHYLQNGDIIRATIQSHNKEIDLGMQINTVKY